jgi:hypothetical protein
VRITTSLSTTAFHPIMTTSRTPRIFRKPVRRGARMQVLTRSVGMMPVTPRAEGDFKPVG